MQGSNLSGGVILARLILRYCSLVITPLMVQDFHGTPILQVTGNQTFGPTTW